MIFTKTSAVNGPCHQLLSGARLTSNEHSRICPCNLSNFEQHVFDAISLAHQLAEGLIAASRELDNWAFALIGRLSVVKSAVNNFSGGDRSIGNRSREELSVLTGGIPTASVSNAMVGEADGKARSKACWSDYQIGRVR